MELRHEGSGGMGTMGEGEWEAQASSSGMNESWGPPASIGNRVSGIV